MVAVGPDSETRETEDASGSLHTAEERVPELNPEAQCEHHFGYLSDRASGEKIPEECMVCEKMLDCMVRTEKNETHKSQ